MQITNLILSGGSGTRLWPLSRKYSPKQFYPLFNGQSLFELTLHRNAAFCQNFMVVTNQDQYILAKQQLGNQASSFVLEPVGRNTAPAIALACFLLDPHELVLVTPSDHLIKKEAHYRAAVEQALAFARDGYLVTFGIQPAYPETGFGYIEAAGNEVRSFREKPDAATAADYLQKGNYYWNSGMFCFTAATFLQELQQHSPDVYAAAEKAAQTFNPGDATHQPSLADMMAIPDISIDYGVMEKSSRVRVVPADIGWSDLGSFDALYDEFPKDANGNSLQSDPLTIDAHNNIIINASGGKTVLIGVNDLMVVQTDTATLIGRRGHSQDVKKVVDALKKSASALLDAHAERALAGGSLRELRQTTAYRLEELTVFPGATVSVDAPAGSSLQLLTGQLTLDGNQLASDPIKSFSTGAKLHNPTDSAGVALLISANDL